MRKIRVAIRNADPSVYFTWTDVLGRHPEYRDGWKYMENDGSFRIEMDKISSVEMDRTPSSKREQILLEENSRLKQLIAGQDVQPDVVFTGTTTGNPEIELEPGETLLPDITQEISTEIPDDIKVLVPPSDITEEPIEETIQLEPPDKVQPINKSKLHVMKKEDLIVHAHALDGNIDLPDGATKRDLIRIILDLQN